MLKKITLLSIVLVLISLFFIFDLQHYLSLNYIKQQQLYFAAYYADHQLLTIGIFAGVYILVTALSLPGAAVMTLAAGVLFGLLIGTILVSFASTIGATLAFLVSRFLLRNWLSGKYAQTMQSINAGIKKDGAFYLFTLRLIPVFPFFLVNILMGLTSINILKYFIISQVGMLPATIVFVYAGLQLGHINSLAGILSKEMLAALVMLGSFPWLAKWMITYIKKKKIMAKYTATNN